MAIFVMCMNYRAGVQRQLVPVQNVLHHYVNEPHSAQVLHRMEAKYDKPICLLYINHCAALPCEPHYALQPDRPSICLSRAHH